MSTELKKENQPVSNSVAWKMPKWVQVFVDISTFLSAFDTCWGLEWKYGIQIQFHHSDR